jgi:hypothetical protein
LPPRRHRRWSGKPRAGSRLGHSATINYRKRRNAVSISATELHRLSKLREEGSPGDWYVNQGLMADSLWITTRMRESDIGEREGPIGHVPTERTKMENDKFSPSETRFRKIPHKRAKADAALIVEAVNALPKLIKALSETGRCDEIGWLIEWPADRHGPVRYFSAGEPPVIDPNHALRFARKEDAEAFMKGWVTSTRANITGAKAVEHMWCAPKTRKAKAA